MALNGRKIREQVLALLARKDYRPLNKVDIARKLGVTGAAGFPFPADTAAEFLVGKPLSLENIDAAARIACENIDYLSDQYAPAQYRRQLVKTEISRALSGLRDRPSS